MREVLTEKVFINYFERRGCLVILDALFGGPIELLNIRDMLLLGRAI